ncbi:MAG: hypothetical protein WCK35_04220 [Chloroflexota bacterium]
MQPDWTYVKKTSLWNYDELLKKLNSVLTYPVIRRAYNEDMCHAAAFCQRLFPTKNIDGDLYPAQILATMTQLELVGIVNWSDLLSRISSRDACDTFIAENNLHFEELINVLNYLLRWGFPFETATWELLDHQNPFEMFSYEALKQRKLMNNFDILEQGQTGKGRSNLADYTGLPLAFINCLAHRADIVRLPFVRRKTLLPICGAGYDTLYKIASADVSEMESSLDTFFRSSIGKSWKNYRSVIVLKGMIATARVLPVIMEE